MPSGACILKSIQNRNSSYRADRMLHDKKDPKQIILSEDPTLAPGAAIVDSSLGRYTELGADATIIESSMGDYSYAMARSHIIYSTIGKFVNIASDVRLNPGNHPTEWVSQHHFQYRRQRYGFDTNDDDSFFAWRRAQRVTIGHDVWLGHKAIVLPGTEVGNGAVVAAGAVVTKDVAPYSIVAGVPARLIRTRFPESIWNKLEQTAWWDWQHEVIKERLPDFRDIRRFLSLYAPSEG